MAAESFRGVFGTNLFPRRCSQPTRLGFSPRPRHFPFAFSPDLDQAADVSRNQVGMRRQNPHEHITIELGYYRFTCC
jgi:hypothetical protein